MSARSFLSLTDLDGTALPSVVDRGLAHAMDPTSARSLEGSAVGLYFRRSSTRTRTSFWRAATLLGAEVVSFGPADLQLSTNESPADTARVLSGYLDLLVARTNDDPAELREMALAGPLGVINALTRGEHPTQAVADLITLKEHFGDITRCHVLYVGEGNSTAAALAYAVALTPGPRLTLLTPDQYGLADSVLEEAEGMGGKGRVAQIHQAGDIEDEVDAVYTSRWLTMGVAKKDPNWLDAFQPYRVTAGFFESVRRAHTVFLHDLPAIRGQEVADEVLDGPASLAWRQSFHKMTGAMAVLEWCAGR